MEAHPGAVEAHPGAVKAHPGAVEAHPGAVEAHPEAVEAHPGAVEAHLELWRLTISHKRFPIFTYPCGRTVRPFYHVKSNLSQPKSKDLQ